MRDSEEHLLLRALAHGLSSREVLDVTREEHVAHRASALGLPDREVIFVTLSPWTPLQGYPVRDSRGARLVRGISPGTTSEGDHLSGS